MAMATHAALMGGHVRVGLEDSLFIGCGEPATSNAQQIEKIKRFLTQLGLEIATPDEGCAMLGLNGEGRVALWHWFGHKRLSAVTSQHRGSRYETLLGRPLHRKSWNSFKIKRLRLAKPVRSVEFLRHVLAKIPLSMKDRGSLEVSKPARRRRFRRSGLGSS